MKRKFYTALAVTIIAGSLFLVINFTHYFTETKLINFMQGFSGGLAGGSLLASIAWGIKWKQGQGAEVVA
ncbi:hypothetical protein [Mucilaginibacter pedocola]|uniref:Uncharacterized protein n=1 Tax=Mucilaginibacter pedocola TaxID=1792845 RepID=A0A1S9PDH5_9SPHI|nr:hypothetical protein [Mucilaginibacter pedocola]OOQ58638.1 hypothetical protein BC343_08205 [Mucilaginibacter pedocola]